MPIPDARAFFRIMTSPMALSRPTRSYSVKAKKEKSAKYHQPRKTNQKLTNIGSVAVENEHAHNLLSIKSVLDENYSSDVFVVQLKQDLFERHPRRQEQDLDVVPCLTEFVLHVKDILSRKKVEKS
jgi:hypothetical protein